MPSIANQETIDLIAQGYVASSMNMTQGLLNAGYSQSYAESSIGHKIYGNIQVKSAIDALMKPAADNNRVTVDNIVKELADMAFAADNISNIDKIRSLELLGKYLSLWTDNINTKSQSLNINVTHTPDKPIEPSKEPEPTNSPTE